MVMLRCRSRANARASACNDGGQPVSAPARSKATTFGSRFPDRVDETGDLEGTLLGSHGAQDEVHLDHATGRRLPGADPGGDRVDDLGERQTVEFGRESDLGVDDAIGRQVLGRLARYPPDVLG